MYNGIWGTTSQKGTTLDYDFYNAVDKQCRTENAYAGNQHNIFILINFFFHYLLVLSKF